MEASFGGSTLGGRCDTHFNTQDYEAMGRAFCETLLDFCDEDPSKVPWYSNSFTYFVIETVLAVEVGLCSSFKRGSCMFLTQNTHKGGQTLLQRQNFFPHSSY